MIKVLKKICSSILIPENNILNIYKRLKFDYKYNKFVFNSVDFILWKDKAFIKLKLLDPLNFKILTFFDERVYVFNDKPLFTKNEIKELLLEALIGKMLSD